MTWAVTPELHRPIAVEHIGPGGLDVAVEANAAECAALAARMDIPAVLSLTCRFHLARDSAGGLLAHASLTARVVQTCVVSLEDFAAPVEEHFAVRCVPAGEESDDADPGALDEIAYADGVLDLGEAAAEQLALALDPYPRAPGAVLPDIQDEAPAGPFDALAARRRH
jgi:Large ribosomal RNA subunit accumulation protein YceD